MLSYPLLGNKYCHDDKREQAIYRSVHDKENEKLEACFGNYTAHPEWTESSVRFCSLRLEVCLPWTEMVHFANTATNLTAVVGPIGLVGETHRAPNRSPIALTRKDISGKDILQAWYHDVMIDRTVSRKPIRRMIIPVQTSCGLFLLFLRSCWDDNTLRSSFVLFFSTPLWTSRNKTWICEHREKEPEISDSD